MKFIMPIARCMTETGIARFSSVKFVYENFSIRKHNTLINLFHFTAHFNLIHGYIVYIKHQSVKKGQKVLGAQYESINN